MTATTAALSVGCAGFMVRGAHGLADARPDHFLKGSNVALTGSTPEVVAQAVAPELRADLWAAGTKGVLAGTSDDFIDLHRHNDRTLVVRVVSRGTGRIAEPMEGCLIAMAAHVRPVQRGSAAPRAKRQPRHWACGLGSAPRTRCAART